MQALHKWEQEATKAMSWKDPYKKVQLWLMGHMVVTAPVAQVMAVELAVVAVELAVVAVVQLWLLSMA